MSTPPASPTVGKNAAPTAPAAPVGSIRPGGRTARVREAVLKAAGDALATEGFAALDLAEIARRADVGRTTVYRRWGTPGALAADLLADMAATSLPRADTGTLDGDLTANARLVVKTLTDPRQGPLFKALIAASLSDDQAAKALHRFYDIRIKEWSGCVIDAIARGELPAGTDPHAVIAAVSAPLYYALLNTGRPPTGKDADEAASSAALTARAGVWCSASSD